MQKTGSFQTHIYRARTKKTQGLSRCVESLINHFPEKQNGRNNMKKWKTTAKDLQQLS